MKKNDAKNHFFLIGVSRKLGEAPMQINNLLIFKHFCQANVTYTHAATCCGEKCQNGKGSYVIPTPSAAHCSARRQSAESCLMSSSFEGKTISSRIKRQNLTAMDLP